jgi:hypothetical protein
MRVLETRESLVSTFELICCITLQVSAVPHWSFNTVLSDQVGCGVRSGQAAQFLGARLPLSRLAFSLVDLHKLKKSLSRDVRWGEM